jgi:hypothetical protein
MKSPTLTIVLLIAIIILAMWTSGRLGRMLAVVFQ